MKDTQAQTTTDARLAQLAEIADEMANALQANKLPELEAYVKRFPQFEIEIRDSHEALLQIHNLREQALPYVAADHDNLPPRHVIGEYRIIRELGRGGMGVVYEAEQSSLERRVALKILPFAALLDPRNLERFHNEARAAAMLKHPNIVSVHSVGVERGVHYYAMDFIDGNSLSDIIAPMRESHGTNGDSELVSKNDGSSNGNQTADTTPFAKLSTERSANRKSFFRSIAMLGIQAAEALHFAHQEGIVHRDIKPSNLLLDQNGKLHIADFGLARIQTAEPLTMTGDMVGTLRYMSPEQVEGHVVDERTDIYSLGATLFELATSRPPFIEENRNRLMRAILDTPAPSAQRIDRNIPTDLANIVAKCLQKSSTDRYRDASELAADLQRFLDHRSIKAKPTTQYERLRNFARRNQAMAWLVGLSACLMIVLTVGSLAVAWNYHQRNRLDRLGFYARDMRLAKQAADEGRVVELQDLLLKWAPNGKEDLRGFEWYHLWNYCQDPALEHSFRHELPQSQVMFSADGNELFVGGFGADIKSWDLATRSPTTEDSIRMNHQGARALARSTNRGEWISGDKTGELLLWDAQTRSIKRRLPIEPTNPLRTAIDQLSWGRNDDALVVSVSYGFAGETVVWSRESDEVVFRMPSENGRPSGVFASQDRLIVGSSLSSELHVYEPESWTEVRRIPIDADGVTALAISPDKRSLAVSVTTDSGDFSFCRVDIWDTEDWTKRSSVPVGKSPRIPMEFSADSTLLAIGDSDGRLWLVERDDESSGYEMLSTRVVHDGRINDVTFSPDGNRIATCGHDGHAHVWKTEPLRAPTRPIATMKQRAIWTTGVCLADDGQMAATADQSGAISIWNMTTGIVDHDREISAQYGAANLYNVASCPKKGLVVVSAGRFPNGDQKMKSGRISIWNTKENCQQSEYVVDRNLGCSPTACTMSSDGRFVAIGLWKRLILIDVRERKLTEHDLGFGAKSVSFSPDEQWLACGCPDGMMRLLELDGMRVAHKIRMDERLIDCIDFSPDGRYIAAVGFDRRVTIYDRKKNIVRRFANQTPTFPCLVRYSHDGTRLLTGSVDGHLQLWRVETAEELMSWRIRNGNWSTGEFTPNGQSLLVRSGGTSQVIHAADPTKLRQLSFAELKSLACQEVTARESQ